MHDEGRAAAETGAPIEAHDLVKRFGGRAALDGISVTVREGEIVVLLGPNGAGKTTLLRTLAGMVTPDTGSARVGGWDVVAERRRAAAATGTLISSEHSWYPRLTGMQNLEFFGAVVGMSPADARRAAAAGLADVGLTEHAGKPVGAYSTGMRTRLGLARARLGDPAVLLLDEPSAALDTQAAGGLLADLREERAHRAVLLSTHSAREAAEIADRALVLDAGRVVREFSGPIEPEALEHALVRG